MAGLQSPDMAREENRSLAYHALKTVGRTEWKKDPHFAEGLNTHLRKSYPNLQFEGFDISPDLVRVNFIDLASEATVWTVAVEKNAKKWARLFIPKEQMENDALITLFSEKMKHRAYTMLRELAQSRLDIDKSDDAQNVLHLMQKGLRSHKALIASLYLKNIGHGPIPDDYVIPFGLIEAMRDDNVLTQQAQPFTDSIWELYEYMHMEREDTAKIDEEIKRFNDNNIEHIRQGSKTTDKSEELKRLHAYIDYGIEKGLLPKPNKENPVPLVHTDFGPGAGRLLDPRVNDLIGRGYEVKTNGVDISDKVTADLRERKGSPVEVYQMLFSQAAKQPALQKSSDLTVCDWGSIQHAYKIRELITSIQSMILCSKPGRMVTLNVTVDNGEVEINQRIDRFNAIMNKDFHHKPGTMRFQYSEDGEIVNIYIPARELWMKLFKDAGLDIMNLNPHTFQSANPLLLPDPIYNVGDRQRLDIVGKAGSVTATDNIVALLLAAETFGALAFPQMIEQKPQDA